MCVAPLESKALSLRETLPSDCVLAFGVPTCEEDFNDSLGHRTREYAKQYFGGWQQYDHFFVSPVRRYTEHYKGYGVEVVFDLRSTGLKSLFEMGSVITLFTHWAAEGVELCDGILALPQMVQCVPEGFSGVLDLCVCHPDDLVKILLRDRPLCSVKYLSMRPAQPLFWLAFYAGLYELLSLQQRRTYSTALTELSIRLRHFNERNDI